jgi:hypothetical protein
MADNFAEFQEGPYVAIQPRPEDRPGEWFCHNRFDWEDGTAFQPIYCPDDILQELHNQGYPVIQYDLGPFEVIGDMVVLEPTRHIPQIVDENGNMASIPLETLRWFATDDNPQRYIGNDGHEYEYWYSPSDYVFFCRDLTVDSDEMECTLILLEEFDVETPDTDGPNGMDDDGAGGNIDAVGALEDEFSNPVQIEG